MLTDFVRVEKLVVILLLRTSQKFRRHVADFEQIEKLVLLTLDRLSCFSDGCFLNGCFLDHCFLNGCLLLWTSQKLNNYFVDFEQIKKKKNFHYQEFICTRCQNIFLPVRTHFHLCFLSAKIYFHLYTFVWILKHQKYWYFFLLKTLWHE